MIGHSGSISFEALRWLADVGVGFIQIDKDGRLLATSAPGTEDARLRRAQALATSNPVGFEIARDLLSRKLEGQARVLAHLQPPAHEQQRFARAVDALYTAADINGLVSAERDAALAYWSAWSHVATVFRAPDRTRVPEHWLRFGQRVSPLTSAPRLAVNPANAMLNYLYAILEAETRIACLTTGLDPALGIVHADYRSRDSLALDLMEAARADIDEYVLRLLRQRTFNKNEFVETERGNCRLASPLAKSLASSATAWAELIAPAVEHTAAMLTNAAGSRIDRLPTPLTQSNRHAAKTAQRRRPARARPAGAALPPSCRGCGGTLPYPERVYCNDCLPDYECEQFEQAFSGSGLAAIEKQKAAGSDPTHGGQAAQRRGAATADRKRELAGWEREYGRVLDLTVFGREILPTIQDIPLSRLVRATGLSLRYCSQIRRGEKIPHPRHWAGFRQAAAEAH